MNEERSRQTRQRSGVGTGTTSLLMIFTVLCFATLAMLSLATSVSNQRMQQRSFDTLENRTATEGQAAEQLAALDAELAGLQRTVPADAYLQAAQAKAAQLGWAPGAQTGQVALTLPMADQTVLVTEVRLLAAGEGARYELVSQVSRWTGEWTPEQGPELWPGLDPAGTAQSTAPSAA